MTQLLSILPQKPPEMERELLRRAQDEGHTPDPSPRRPTFALYTLGCKVNQYDSHQIARMLVARGFRRVEFRESADLYVIDTCTVTAEADKKSRKAAGRARRNNPDAVVAVTGCAATRDREQFLRLNPEGLVLNNAQKFDLPERALQKLESQNPWFGQFQELRQATGSEPVPGATRERAVLKIQDGCNHKCSYCIIPTVRGTSVLRTRAELVAQARAFVNEGAREIVVTGVSLGDWNEEGRPRPSSGKNADLCTLLKAVATTQGLERLRVSSLDPADVDEEWLQTVATTPKICPQIHLALQSGSAGVLKRMRRRYTPELFLKWARRWREIAPHGGLTTDVIVGFPGETEEEWQETLQLCREARFSAIHVFPYSPRQGTFAAANLGALGGLVAPDVQNRRVAELLALGRESTAEFVAPLLGTRQEILVEDGGSEGYVEGLLPNYVRGRVRYDGPRPQVGDIVAFMARTWDDGCLQGEACS